MGGVTTGPVAAVRWFFLVTISWTVLAFGSVALIMILKWAGASLDVAMVSFFAFLLLWLSFSFSRSYSRLIDWLVNFFEGGLLPEKISCFRQPAVSEIHTYFTEYISPILGVPTTPPRRLA